MIRREHRRDAEVEKNISTISTTSPPANALVTARFSPLVEKVEMFFPMLEENEKVGVIREKGERVGKHLHHLHHLHQGGGSPADEWPDAPVVDVYRDPSPYDPDIVVVWVLCPWCHRCHKHGGVGLRTSSCGRSYYVAGVRTW